MSQSFSSLGIKESFHKSLLDLKIDTPTDIQTKSIPVLLNQSEDFVGIAKTGTGKTVAYGLPILQNIEVENPNIQVVVIAPTRELGQQIYSDFITFAKYSPEISIVSICGGTPIKPQMESLKSEVHVVVATPGRLNDLIDRQAIDIHNVNCLVLDEADEIISSLKEDIDDIISELPKNKRTVLFTATLQGALKQLIHNYMSKNVIQISADMQTIGHQGIEHEYIVVDPIEKLEILMYFLNTKEKQRGIIFCRTKAAVNKLAKNLAINKFSSGALHGSLSQPVRDRIMKQFRKGNIDILVATDLAARGIDVKEISFVVNYHLPEIPETYVHRSGRTARAGANGYSLTVLQQEEIEDLKRFESELGINFNKLKKANAQSIEDNNAVLWAKKIFKTKPNHDISMELKERIQTIFHHLTKDELVEKILSNYIQQNSKIEK